MDKTMTALIIMDGFGINPAHKGNAIYQQGTPKLDALMAKYPHTQLGASGMDVGLPDGQMGNSEVGHLNIGAGRIVYQELTRITKAITRNIKSLFLNRSRILSPVPFQNKRSENNSQQLVRPKSRPPLL